MAVKTTALECLTRGNGDTLDLTPMERAALLGPSLSVPFVEGKLTLGSWQQIILCDFDTRPRGRQIVAQIMGE